MKTGQPGYSLFYVLNGLVNGEGGCFATTSGFGDRMTDGHYFLPEDGSTDDGHGPFYCREDADAAGAKYVYEHETDQMWVFALGQPPRRMTLEEESDPSFLSGDSGDFGHVNDVGGGKYHCFVDGSYEEVDLTITAPSHATAARVFSDALKSHYEHCQ